MYPYLFEETFGRVFFLRSYVLLLLTAAVVVYLLIRGPGLQLYRAKLGHGGPAFGRADIRAAAALAVVALLVGARALYVALYWEPFAARPERILRFWEGGLAFHGGLAGALVAVAVFARMRRVPLLQLLDMALPFVAVGYAIGRVGCFLNGCCGGLPTQLPWGMRYPGPWPLRLHPTQLYSSVAGILMFVFLLPLYRRSRKVGSSTAAFLLCASSYRFLLEFVRVHRPADGGLSPFQINSIAVALLGLLILLWSSSEGTRAVQYRPFHRGSRRSRERPGLLVAGLVAGLFLATSTQPLPAEQAPPSKPPVQLHWGVPEGRTMGNFSGLQRSPQAEGLTLDGDTLSVTWRPGNSYIVPIFASSEHTLEGIRYFGYGIPEHLEIEWLDPWRRVWYPIAEIPPEMIRFDMHRNRSDTGPVSDTVAIDFGPPAGAEFHPEMSRFIWFRLTPTQAGEFTVRIFGYLMEHKSSASTENHGRPESASNVIELECLVQAE